MSARDGHRVIFGSASAPANSARYTEHLVRTCARVDAMSLGITDVLSSSIKGYTHVADNDQHGPVFEVYLHG